MKVLSNDGLLQVLAAIKQYVDGRHAAPVHLTAQQLAQYNRWSDPYNLAHTNSFFHGESYIHITPDGIYIAHICVSKEFCGDEAALLEDLPRQYSPDGTITGIGVYPGSDSGYNSSILGQCTLQSSGGIQIKLGGNTAQNYQDDWAVTLVGYKNV